MVHKIASLYDLLPKTYTSKNTGIFGGVLSPFSLYGMVRDNVAPKFIQQHPNLQKGLQIKDYILNKDFNSGTFERSL